MGEWHGDDGQTYYSYDQWKGANNRYRQQQEQNRLLEEQNRLLEKQGRELEEIKILNEETEKDTSYKDEKKIKVYEELIKDYPNIEAIKRINCKHKI